MWKARTAKDRRFGLKYLHRSGKYAAGSVLLFLSLLLLYLKYLRYKEWLFEYIISFDLQFPRYCEKTADY